MYLVRIGDDEPFISSYIDKEGIKENFADHMDEIFIVDLNNYEFTVDAIHWKSIEFDHL